VTVRLKTRLLFLFGAGYSFLFILSLLFIVPRYLSGELGSYLLGLLMDTESLQVSLFFAPLIWILIPLVSIGLCVMSWVAFDASNRSTRMKKLTQIGGVLLFAASILPAMLVARELLVYRLLGVELPDVVAFLTRLTLAVKGIMSPTALLRRGSWVIPVVIFVETGLFFGFFLPGDSLLLTVGVLGAAGYLDLALLTPLSILAAILGDQLGYAIGRRSGDALSFQYRFVRDNLQRASDFFSEHGGKAIVLARFVPVVRTFAPILAGAARMPYLRFTLTNIAGGTFWVVSITLGGYFIGAQVPIVMDYIDTLLVIMILASPIVWASAWAWGRTRKAK
jgi:membrane-associated protein